MITKCPHCGSDTFKVDAVMAVTDTIQFTPHPDDPEDFDFIDQSQGDSDWDENGTVRCADCDFAWTYAEWSADKAAPPIDSTVTTSYHGGMRARAQADIETRRQELANLFGTAAMHSIPIGAVCFAVDGKYAPIMGPERVALLRALYRGELLPEGHAAILLNPQRPVTRDQINWATAGEQVTE